MIIEKYYPGEQLVNNHQKRVRGNCHYFLFMNSGSFPSMLSPPFPIPNVIFMTPFHHVTPTIFNYVVPVTFPPNSVQLLHILSELSLQHSANLTKNGTLP